MNVFFISVTAIATCPPHIVYAVIIKLHIFDHILLFSDYLYSTFSTLSKALQSMPWERYSFWYKIIKDYYRKFMKIEG